MASTGFTPVRTSWTQESDILLYAGDGGPVSQGSASGLLGSSGDHGWTKALMGLSSDAWGGTAVTASVLQAGFDGPDPLSWHA